MMRDERPEDNPPYSRLFIVCSKYLRDEDLLPHFEKYGDVEEFQIPRDRRTGESKGIAYVKYVKTSSAAAAMEALHMKHINNSSKPIKVIVSCQKNDEKNENENRYKRLFIKVSKETTESEIKDHFKKFGNVAHVRIQKDRETNEPRGFAYVNYYSFLTAAIAYEECDRKYKAVFATPVEDLKRSRNYFDRVDEFPSNPSLDCVYMPDYRNDMGHNLRDNMKNRSSILPMIKTTSNDFDTIEVSCSPCVSQRPIEKLFNVIPGMTQFMFTTDSFSGISKAVIKYDTKIAATHAIETLNNYEFPSGEMITVKPQENPLSKVANNLTNIVNNFKNSRDPNTDLMQLADAIAQATSVIKAATSANNAGGADIKVDISSFCSVKLPPSKPLAQSDSIIAQRCFIVLKPHALPSSVLRDIFCRFGDLIDVSALPYKNYGFAKYASAQSAQDAIKTLNGASVHGVLMKVLEAVEKPNKDDKTVDDDDTEPNDERKRAKLDKNVTNSMTKQVMDE